jgi:hypothetical protein
MATLGPTNPSWNYYNWTGVNTQNQAATSLLTMPVNGVVTAITWYAAGKNGNGSVNATGVVWGNNGTVLCNGGTISMGAGSGKVGGQAWHTVGINNFYLAAGTQIRVGWWRAKSGYMEWSTGSGTSYTNTNGTNGPASFSTDNSYGGIGAYITYTPVGPPGVATYGATNVSYTSATLNGAVYPNNVDTDYYWEYGTTTGYGSVTPTFDAGGGGATVGVAANIGGLTGGTTYHAQLIAFNSQGTVGGGDITFTTPIQFSAPLAPTPIAPTAGSLLDASNGVTLTAMYNATDGFNQNAYQLAVATDGGAVKYWNGTTLQTGATWVTDSNNTAPGQSFSVFLSNTVVSNGHAYAWQFASQESGQNLQGPLSAAQSFTAQAQPSWNAPFNPQTSAQDNLNQLLLTHSVNTLYDGVRVDDLNTAHTSWVSLFNSQTGANWLVGGAFDLTGTNIGRIEIPIQLPSTEATSCDVAVQLWDANRTTLIAQTVIPADILTRCAGVNGADVSQLLRFQQDALGTYTTSAQSLVTKVYDFASAAAPSNTLIIGGVTVPGIPADAISQVQIGQFDSSKGDYTSWNIGPAYPLNIYDAQAEYMNGYVYVMGGFVGPGGTPCVNVYSAAFADDTSVLSQWQAQAGLPQTNGVSGQASCNDGTTLYTLGGYDGTSAQTGIWYTQPSNGNISAWSVASLPEAAIHPFACCLNGYLIVFGYRPDTSFTNTSRKVWYAKIDPSVNGGAPASWLRGPDLPAAISAFNGIVFGNSITVFGGDAPTGNQLSQVYTISFNSGLWGKWARLSDLPPFTATDTTIKSVVMDLGGSNSFVTTDGSIAYVSILTGATNNYDAKAPTSIIATSTPVPYISVPMPVSGLTNGARYWVLLRPLEENPVNAPQVSYSSYGPGTGSRFTAQCYGTETFNSLGVGTFVLQAGSLNLRVYDQSATGRLLNTSEDHGAKWTWIVYDELYGIPRYFAECIARTNVPSVAAMYQLQYDNNAVLIDVA